ncbi:flavin-containing monooxygenase [Microbacterium sp. No. 7]|uniref:flavin-containing monooxygenase n=1 Tax=Microbacterium sp. No. 7 TaxID=1714373 RepID=UPI0006ECE8E1|nr:NAD(P)/FAD-dependent oxidoreductase [Microbacterium sp. No. 7]ALJ20851.1 monooxygenase [Microbacterium sp. No. 7]
MADGTPLAVDFDATIRRAVADANVPTLLMVLVQLTGELSWLAEPYAPTRGKGLSENDSGGLSDEVQREIKDAAAEAIIAWRAGRAPAIPEPDEALLTRMLSVAMGEHVPDEYGPMIAEDLAAFAGLVEPEARPAAAPPGFSAIVVGAGISGMLAARELRRAGIAVTVFEASERPGGTWWINRYPGCGVDVPSHLYSFADAPYDWPYYYATRDELFAYLEKVAGDWDMNAVTRYGTRVLAARWSDETQRWTVEIEQHGVRASVEANIVISGVGAFGTPKTPSVPGIDSFAGPTTHTAEWPEGFDVRGKRVGVIGNGASAMQVVPAIAPEVASLTLFQRSAHWVAPFEKFRTPVPDSVRFLLAEVPLYRSWYRQRLSWVLNDTLYPALQKDPGWPHPERSLNAQNDGHRRFFTRYIESELEGFPELIEKVTPPYPPFGKRILLDNGWYRTLRRDNVELVTDAISEVTGGGVVLTDGRRIELDALVFATGFDVAHFLASFEVVGRGGVTLREQWGDDARSYIGTAAPGFPNLFTLYGPNTQAGHGGSLIFYLESQMRYVLSLLEQMFAAGATVAEVRGDVTADYNRRVDEAHERMIWTAKGFDTYYRNSRGRVVVANPWRVIDWWRMTNRARAGDFVLRDAAGHEMEAGT